MTNALKRETFVASEEMGCNQCLGYIYKGEKYNRLTLKTLPKGEFATECGGCAPVEEGSYGANGWTGNECPECEGSGEVDSDENDGRCLACGGTGDEYVPFPSTDLVQS